MGILTERISEYCGKYQYPYHLDVFDAQDPLVVLIGENHRLEDLPPQEELIGIVQPKIIFHEVFQKYDKKVSYNNHRDEIPYDRRHMKRISAWRHLFGVPVRRLDVPKAMRREIDKRALALLQIVKLTRDSQVYNDLTVPIRETYMIQLIADALQREQTPVFGVAGDGHLNPLAKPGNYLAKLEIPHAIISQSPEVKDYLDHACGYYVLPC